MSSLSWRGAGALSVGLVLLAGCAQRDVPEGEVERTIRDGMADRGVEILELDCPGGVPMEVDASVVCDVQLAGVDPLGTPVDRIRVVVTSVDGDEVGFRLEPIAIGAPEDATATD